jgi:hypothetical protein
MSNKYFLRFFAIEDSLSGQIVTPSIISSGTLETARYTLVIDVKGGKYRLRFSDYRIDRGDIFHNIPLAEAEKEFTVMFSGVKKQSYWNVQKRKLRNEASKIDNELSAFILKDDSF